MRVLIVRQMTLLVYWFVSFKFKAVLTVHEDLEVTVPAAFSQSDNHHSIQVTILSLIETIKLARALSNEN